MSDSLVRAQAEIGRKPFSVWRLRNSRHCPCQRFAQVRSRADEGAGMAAVFGSPSPRRNRREPTFGSAPARTYSQPEPPLSARRQQAAGVLLEPMARPAPPAAPAPMNFGGAMQLPLQLFQMPSIQPVMMQPMSARDRETNYPLIRRPGSADSTRGREDSKSHRTSAALRRIAARASFLVRSCVQLATS